MFTVNDLLIRAGGSALTAKEYVYVNDILVAEGKSYRASSEHDFIFQDCKYQIQFEFIDKAKGILCCRLYCNDALQQLFVATPQQNVYIGPVFAVFFFCCLYLDDLSAIDISIWHYITGFVVAVITDMVYRYSHIRITNLEV